jgi:hypothetical protein
MRLASNLLCVMKSTILIHQTGGLARHPFLRPRHRRHTLKSLESPACYRTNDNIMTDTLCVIHELANLLARDTSLRAVLLDAHQRRVSFACMPGCDEATKQADLERILREFRPDDVPACATDPWRVDCKLCTQGQRQPMPPGIRLISLPRAGC